MDIAALRKDYSHASLSEAEVLADPIDQFHKWFAEALEARLPEPNAMSLATVGADGRPSSRIVLIKDLDARGFTFYTNYASRKGHQLAVHDCAALLFHWVELERQVRIEGKVEQVSAAESDAYFASRPLGSRLGAIASAQSETIADRAALEAQFTAAWMRGSAYFGRSCSCSTQSRWRSSSSRRKNFFFQALCTMLPRSLMDFRSGYLVRMSSTVKPL